MTPLKEGDKAPYFEGINQDGKKITLDVGIEEEIGRTFAKCTRIGC